MAEKSVKQEKDISANKRSAFGNRFLSENDNVFQHNAWDNVMWDQEQEELARHKIAENSTIALSADELEKYEKEADKYWDKFYGIHSNRFFKDRHWLFTEFPELAANKIKSKEDTPLRSTELLDVQPTDGYKILEIGCGVGNTVFPILLYNSDPNLFVYCCDFSTVAIDILKENSAYDTKRCKAFVLDVTQKEWNTPFEKGTLDVVILIFVLSAIHPNKMKHVIEQINQHLKPGGIVLFRDYGRYDLAQLRFKKGNCLAQNFYVRGDGTKAYFFTQDEVRALFMDSNFTEEQNFVDRRLQVNRGKRLTMYRVWIQGKYRKTC